MRTSDDERSKRRRLSDGEYSDVKTQKPTLLSERQPTKSVDEGNLEIKLQRTYSKSPTRNINNSPKPPKPPLISNIPHRPYGPKQIPISRIDKSQPNLPQRPEVKRGAETQFFRALESNNDSQYRPPSSQSPGEKQIPTKSVLKQSNVQRQQHIQVPRHRLNQYDCVNTSRHDDPDDDPFADGYQQSARNRNQSQAGRPRIGITGISSAIQPGETSSFMRDVDGKKGTFVTSDGIKIRRTK